MKVREGGGEGCLRANRLLPVLVDWFHSFVISPLTMIFFPLLSCLEHDPNILSANEGYGHWCEKGRLWRQQGYGCNISHFVFFCLFV